MFDSHSIGHLLLETGRISKTDYAEAISIAKKTAKSAHEILLSTGKISVDELVQAITIHVDITLLKEALGLEKNSRTEGKHARPLGAYLERISMLFKMGVLISNQKNVAALLDLLIREAPSIMNAERATIFIADFDRKELYSHLGVGLTHDQIRIPWDSGIAGWVFTHGKPLNIVEPYKDPRFNRGVDPRTGFVTKNLLCVPLRVPAGVSIGVFQVLNKRAGVFTSTDTEILEILASQAARSLEHALEWDKLNQQSGTITRDNVDLKTVLHNRDPLDEIIGATKPIQEVRTLIRKVSPTDSTVLIQGESGTGKELVARAIHKLSSRSDQPLITLNCAAIPAELIESELFGHRKGSFTGAVSDHKGVFRAAHKGTLFLDEIETMSPAMQVKVLRAIQVGEIKSIGETTSQIVDVRLIAATNRDLLSLIKEGRFREDLFYRVNVFPIIIPPLRDRVDDIPLLAKHFLDKFNFQTGSAVKKIDSTALDIMTRYNWPGNVRELENEIERAHILTGDETNISVRCLSQRITQFLEKIVDEKSKNESLKLKEAIDQLEKSMIVAALQSCDGNRTLTAKRLGLSRQGLINKIYKYGLTSL